MAKHYILGFEPPARLEQIGDQDCPGVRNRKHQPSKCDDSTSARESTPDGIFGKDSHQQPSRLQHYWHERKTGLPRSFCILSADRLPKTEFYSQTRMRGRTQTPRQPSQ
jgi:hypothetical protein